MTIVTRSLTKCSMLFLCFSIVLIAGAVSAQQSFLTFTLSPGPYAVGFKSVNQFDNSRSFSRYSAEGTLVNKGGTRPIQTSIWYPAEKGDNEILMQFEDYVDLAAFEVGFPEMTSEVRLQARKGIQSFYNSPNSRFESELKAKTKAVRDAGPASGSFPVIIYAPSIGSQSFENSVLFEYLASHGYIVVSSPSMGQESRAMTMDITGIEAQVNDIEFLISFAYTLPSTNMEELAVMGFSWGGISNVLAKMRNDNIKAVICLDGSIRLSPDLFIKSPYADSVKMNVPFLYLAAQNRTFEQLQNLKRDYSYNFYNSLRYSDAYIITFNLLWHQNFASSFIKLIERNHWYDNESTQEEVNQGYELICLYTLNFLDAYLKNNKQALAYIQNKPAMNGIPPYLVTRQFKTAMPSPPALTEFKQALIKANFADASQTYAEMKKVTPDFSLEEGQLDNWGYELLWRGKLREAIEIFKLNVELNPSSYNTYASLGEAYFNDGKKELAIRNLEKSVELNSQFLWTTSFLQKLKE